MTCGCSGVEIAGYLDIDQDTFYRRVQEKFNLLFTEYAGKKREKGNSLLREKQFSLALKGDKALLIWLGKQKLGQTESPQELNISPQTVRQFNELMGQLDQLQKPQKDLNIDDSNNNSELKS